MKRDRWSALALAIIIVICMGEGILFDFYLSPNAVQLPDVDVGEQHTMTFWLAKNNERNESLVPESAVLTVYRCDTVFMVMALSRTASVIPITDEYNRTVYGLFGIAEKTVSKLYFHDIRITIETDMDEWCLERGFETMVTNGPHWLNYWTGDTPRIGTLVAGSRTIMNWPDVSFEDEISLSIHLVDRG
jgi:hypothetical protein